MNTSALMECSIDVLDPPPMIRGRTRTENCALAGSRDSVFTEAVSSLARAQDASLIGWRPEPRDLA